VPRGVFPTRMCSVVIRVSIAILAVLIVATVSIVLARHENRVARERVYAMMRDADDLRVNESNLEDVLELVRKYRGKERSLQVGVARSSSGPLYLRG